MRTAGSPGAARARFQLDRYTYRLPDIATLVTDEWPAAQHTALGDARATGLVPAALINQAPQRLSWYGPAPARKAERLAIVAARAGLTQTTARHTSTNGPSPKPGREPKPAAPPHRPNYASCSARPRAWPPLTSSGTWRKQQRPNG